jgi:hypothetical protein
VKFDIPDYAKGDKELWTPQLMRDALVHAFRVLKALPGSGYSNAAPVLIEFNDDWGYADEEQNETRLQPKAIDISRMELLLIGKGSHQGLLNGDVLEYRGRRRILVRWANWVASGCRDPDGEHETEEWFSFRIRCPSEATMKRYRDYAAGVMAQQANREGVAVWHAEKPVRRRKKRMNLHAASSG